MSRQTVSGSTSAGEAKENIDSPTTKLPSDTVDYVARMAVDNGSAAPNRSGGKVRFPASQSPLVTLLKKKREGVLPSGAAYIDPPTVTDSDKLLSEVMDYLEKESAVVTTGSSNSTTKANLHQVPSSGLKMSTAPGPVAEIVPVSTRRLAFETVAPTGTVIRQKANDPHSRKFQPRKIEYYVPGRSSLASLEPSTVDGHNQPIVKPGLFSRYLESDTEVEYRIRKKTPPMSPSQTDNSVRDLYKRVQKGGQIPSEGLKYSTFETKRAYSVPSSSLQYHQQSSHTTADGRMETFTKDQGENVALRKLELNRIIAEERRKKLEAVSRDIQSRRHSDFFMPSQKSPVPLNRYEEDVDERVLLALPSKKKVISKVRGKAKALYNFRAQNSRELSFRKGDILHLTRQIDKNWFEGERHGLIGRFPISYVEVIISLDSANAVAEESEGSARALYNFSAQSSVELSLRKGDLVKLIRRVDENWLEGCISSRRGIFPVRYVEILIEPNMSCKTPMSSRTVTPMIGSPLTLSPANSLISIGPAPTIPSAPISPVDSELMDESRWNSELLYPPPNRWSANSQPAVVASRHLRDREYRVPTPVQRVYYSSGGLDEPLSLAPAQPVRPLSRSSSAGQSSGDQLTVIVTDSGTPSERINGNSFANSVRNLSSAYRFENGDDKASTWALQSTLKNRPLQEKQSASKPLHLRYPVYRAQYKYIPRKSDELSLNVGDVVYVVEKCVDGWFVGFLERSNDFGTFPGNYVQQLW